MAASTHAAEQIQVKKVCDLLLEPELMDAKSQDVKSQDVRFGGSATTCLDCGAVLDGVPEYARRCGECYLTRKEDFATKEKRDCVVCKEPRILKVAPAWQTICSFCYATKSKKCQGCDGLVKPTAEKYQIYCHSCYLAKRAVTHDKCPMCPEERKDHLRKKKGDPFCTACALQINKS